MIARNELEDKGHRLARVSREKGSTFKREMLNALAIVLGVFSATFGLNSFLLPNDFIDGGITGISLLISAVSGWQLSLLIVCLNIPFVVLGYRQLGLVFALKTGLGILALAVCVHIVHFPAITDDKLLVAVFGGFFLGAGIGLAMRGGGVIDGTEVMAIAFSKNTGLTIGDIILIVNVVIFCFAAWLLSIETALYSILTYLSASKTVDFVVEGIEEYTGVTIISSHNEEIKKMITDGMGRGVTVYKGARGYSSTADGNGNIDILYSVITRLEVVKLNTEIAKIDPTAFVIMNRVKDTRGGMIKKRALH